MKRKWFFGILILVVVAIVLAIVFINLFKEKDTKALVNSLNSFAEDGYLADDSEDLDIINNYLDKMLTYFEDGEEKTEVKNHKASLSAFLVVVDFFNNQMVFTKHSTEYNDNKKEIENALKKSQEVANKLVSHIKETDEDVGESYFWNTNTWQKSREYLKTMFEQNFDAFTRLGIVYTASVESSLMNNAYTELIFGGFDRVANQVLAKLSADESKGQAFLNFVNAYYSDAAVNDILGYRYNETLQNSVKEINEQGVESALYTDFLAGNVAK